MDSAYVELSSADISEAATNVYPRLAWLLIEEGTKCVRKTVLSHIQNDHFSSALATNKYRFTKLRDMGRITKAQYAMLYPKFEAEVEENDIDLTLWVMLARNITASCNKINWTAKPKDSQKLWQHDVIRIRDARNRLFHMITAEGSGDECREIRATMTSALSRLGCRPEDIDSYFSRDMEPHRRKMYELQVREQYLQEVHCIYKAGVKGKRQSWILITVLVAMTAAIVVAIVVPIEIFKKEPQCAVNIGWQTGESGQFKVMSRSGWGARGARYDNDTAQRLHLPVKNVVIFHTAMVTHCALTEECCGLVRKIQNLHMDVHNWSDIGYNYLIGDDGTVFEGRGFQYIGAASIDWNHKMISLAFLGNYICDVPSRVAFTSMYTFIEYLVGEGVVMKNYTLYGHCQTAPTGNFNRAPGAALMQQLTTLHHWRNYSIDTCQMNADCVESLYIYCRPPIV